MNYSKSIAMFVLGMVIAGAGFFFTASHASAAFLPLVGEQNLTVGSTGASVTQLQGLLGELGYLNVPINVPFGYFGSLTKNALAQYQASNGLPSTGFFGPMTRAQMRTAFATRGWLSLLNY